MKYVYAIAKRNGKLHLLHPDSVAMWTRTPKRILFNIKKHILCESDVEISDIQKMNMNEDNSAICKNCMNRLKDVVEARGEE